MSHINDSTAARRIREILDQDSFVELGAYVTARSTDFGAASEEASSDGVVTGYGTIDGKLVYIYAQDPEIFGGSVGEMHAKKIRRLYAFAVKMGAPVIGLIDCAGVRLAEATDALFAFGSLYREQALASGVVPQIQAVYGLCGGSLAVSAALADFTFMEKDAKLFFHAPNAISGNTEAELDTASAAFRSEESGTADFVGTQEEIAAGIRALVGILPSSNDDDDTYGDCEDSLNRLVPEVVQASGAGVLRAISDDGFVCEPGQHYGCSVTTAFIRLNGCTVGAIAAASGEVCFRGVEKAARFAKFCDAFSIPLLTVVNSAGFEKTLCNEKRLPQAVAALINAYAEATVPKVTLLNGTAHGLLANVFAPRAVADIVYAWPNAELALIDAGAAVKILYASELEKAENKTAFFEEKKAQYLEKQGSAMSAAKRGYVDDIIAPETTRKRVIAAFEMLFTKNEEIPAKKHGTV